MRVSVIFVPEESILTSTSSIVGFGVFSPGEETVLLFEVVWLLFSASSVCLSPQEEKTKAEDVKIDVINIFKGLYDYKVTANADVNLKTTKEDSNIRDKYNIMRFTYCGYSITLSYCVFVYLFVQIRSPWWKTVLRLLSAI